MSLFFPEQRASAGTIGPPRDPVVAAWFGQGSQSASGMNVTPDNALRVTAVYRAVSLLAQTYASMPLGVFKLMPNGGSVLDIEHPLQYILTKKPNKWQTSFEWREMMYGHFALRGRCYSEILSTGGKSVAQLVPLHPDHVRPFRAPNGKLAFEYSPLEGTTRVILQNEMCYLHGLTVGEDGITPLSPISAAGREAIGNALATQEHSGKLFANGTRLGGLLKMPGHLADDTKRKGLLDGWNRAFGGTRNTGKTALLEDGLEWQALGMTSEDAQIIETMQFSIADISRIFDGIPLHLLSELSKSTNNNIEEQGIGFVTHTIRPGAVRREEALERDLLYGKDAITHCIKFDLDSLMRGNMDARSKFYASVTQNGIKTRNECRIREGDNPSDVKGMDEFTVQLNMTTIDKVGLAPPKPDAPTEPPAARSADQRDTPIVMHVTMPEVRSPDVTVNVQPVKAPDINLTVTPEVRTPDVIVNAPPVHVLVPELRAGDTIVNMPSDMNMRITGMPKRRTSSEIERDSKGDIIGTVQTEKDA